MPGSGAETCPRLSKRWWQQNNLDVEGMQTAYIEAEITEGGGWMDGAETEID